MMERIVTTGAPIRSFINSENELAFRRFQWHFALSGSPGETSLGAIYLQTFRPGIDQFVWVFSR